MDQRMRRSIRSIVGSVMGSSPNGGRTLRFAPGSLLTIVFVQELVSLAHLFHLFAYVAPAEDMSRSPWFPAWSGMPELLSMDERGRGEVKHG